ncbi:MAG: DUF975 family protein [Clostridia bacterium]|nr:DUF975 family protein [Clostridia bacterium]
MLSVSEIKKQAKSNLQGKWSTVVVLSLIYIAISYAITYASNFIPFIGIGLLIITIPLQYGLIYSFIKIYRNEKYTYSDLFTSTFNNFTKIWKVIGNQLLKLIVPIILLIVSTCILVGSITFIYIASNNTSDSNTIYMTLAGIFLIIGYIGYIASIIYLYVKDLLYVLSYYVMYDNPNLTAKQIVEESERVMKGQRGKYFSLGLSFFGWILLVIITFGIGIIFLMPYIQISIAIFYEDRIGKLNEVNVENTNI